MATFKSPAWTSRAAATPASVITWDPTQPTATQPLAIQKNGTWYTYGHDLTKNVTELYNTNGTIATAYDYTPFGQVTATGTADQPIQWSSEYNDAELGLIYYNYRHYNPTDGRWINRDPIAEQGGWNLYGFVNNKVYIYDIYGNLLNFIISGIVSAVTEVAIQVVTNYVEDKPLLNLNYAEVVTAGVIGTIPGPSVIAKVKQLSKLCAKNKRVVDNVVKLTKEIEKINSTKKGNAQLTAILEMERAAIIEHNNKMWASYSYQKFICIQ